MTSTALENPDKRELPEGWVQEYDEKRKRWFYKQVTLKPPRISYAHPLGALKPSKAAQQTEPILGVNGKYQNAQDTPKSPSDGVNLAQQLYKSGAHSGDISPDTMSPSQAQPNLPANMRRALSASVSPTTPTSPVQPSRRFSRSSETGEHNRRMSLTAYSASSSPSPTTPSPASGGPRAYFTELRLPQRPPHSHSLNVSGEVASLTPEQAYTSNYLFPSLPERPHPSLPTPPVSPPNHQRYPGHQSLTQGSPVGAPQLPSSPVYGQNPQLTLPSPSSPLYYSYPSGPSPPSTMYPLSMHASANVPRPQSVLISHPPVIATPHPPAQVHGQIHGQTVQINHNQHQQYTLPSQHQPTSHAQPSQPNMHHHPSSQRPSGPRRPSQSQSPQQTPQYQPTGYTPVQQPTSPPPHQQMTPPAQPRPQYLPTSYHPPQQHQPPSAQSPQSNTQYQPTSYHLQSQQATPHPQQPPPIPHPQLVSHTQPPQASPQYLPTSYHAPSQQATSPSPPVSQAHSMPQYQPTSYNASPQQTPSHSQPISQVHPADPSPQYQPTSHDAPPQQQTSQPQQQQNAPQEQSSDSSQGYQPTNYDDSPQQDSTTVDCYWDNSNENAATYTDPGGVSSGEIDISYGVDVSGKGNQSEVVTVDFNASLDFGGSGDSGSGGGFDPNNSLNFGDAGDSGLGAMDAFQNTFSALQVNSDDSGSGTNGFDAFNAVTGGIQGVQDGFSGGGYGDGVPPYDPGY